MLVTSPLHDVHNAKLYHCCEFHAKYVDIQQSDTQFNMFTWSFKHSTRPLLCIKLHWNTCEICCTINDECCTHDESYLELEKLAEVWNDVVLDAVQRAGQRDATKEQDDEKDVRRRGGDVHHLARRLHTCKHLTRRHRQHRLFDSKLKVPWWHM